MASSSTEGSSTSVFNKIRVFMIPFFATGHLIPTAELARLLQSEYPNVEPTIVTTPANADILTSFLGSVDSNNASVNVKIITYPFPSVGLPPGVENLSTARADESWRVDEAAQLSQPAQESLLRDHKPDAIFADFHFWWTTKIANELSIPRFIFCPIGMFPLVVMNSLAKIGPDILARKDEDPYQCHVTVPELPGQQISMPVSELPFFLRDTKIPDDADNNFKSAQLNGSGTVVNTSSDLESEYYETFMKIVDPKVYLVGPLGLSALKDKSQATKRGGQGNTDCIISWLDEMPSRSVVFICFGSWCNFSVEQLEELALGLEESEKNFLWVVRDGNDVSEEWMPERWEEQVKSRGLVVKGWAPQVEILRHESVGAFLTHCGWNSILEAVSAGVPMLTWPLVFEQFINERFVVEVKGYGARVWEGGKRSTVENEKVVVPRDVISHAVSQFMEPGGVGDTARARIQAMMTMSSNAATSVGGSSQRDLRRLIDDLLKAKED